MRGSYRMQYATDKRKANSRAAITINSTIAARRNTSNCAGKYFPNCGNCAINYELRNYSPNCTANSAKNKSNSRLNIRELNSN